MERVSSLLSVVIAFILMKNTDASCGKMLSGQSGPLDAGCSMFIICVGNQLLPMKCPVSLRYDIVVGACIPKGQCSTSPGTAPTVDTTIIIPTAPTIAPPIPTAKTIVPTSITAATPSIPTAKTLNPITIPTARTIGPTSYTTFAPEIPTAKTINPVSRTTSAPPIPTAPTAGSIGTSTAGTKQPTNSPCEGMPTGLYLNSPNSNAEFFYCYEGYALLTQCPTGSIFIFEKQICEPVTT